MLRRAARVIGILLLGAAGYGAVGVGVHVYRDHRALHAIAAALIRQAQQTSGK